MPPTGKSSSHRSHPQTGPDAKFSGDTTSVDAIVRALYESISFAPNSPPDYNRLRSLFHPGGRLIPPKQNPSFDVAALEIEEFIKNSWENIILTGLESKGFYEHEVRRFEEAAGDIAHVFSVYESRNRSEDAEPIQRGINSIQLVKDANRWWLLSVLWDREDPQHPFPSQYR